MKTRSLQFCALSTAVLAACYCPANPWPQYRGPNVDGISPEAIHPNWLAQGPKRLWQVPTTDGFSSFASADHKVFTLITRTVDGAPSEVCLALDADSGRELWAVPVGPGKYPGGGDSGTDDNKGGDGPRSTPAVVGGRVYVYSSDMVLVCLDPATGKTIWKKDIVGEYGGKNIGWKSAMSPVVDGELLYIAGGGPGQAMLAFNAASGALAWKTGDDAMTHATPVVATIHDVRQVIFLMQSGLVALNVGTGQSLWRFPFKYRTSTACSPVVGGDVVFCTAGYDIGGAACRVVKNGNAFTAEGLWKVAGNNAVASLWSTPVYKDGYLYGMISFKKFGNGPLKCVDLKTGAVKWEQPGFGAGNVVLVGNHLLALADNGELVVVETSPEAYKEVTRFKAIEGKCWSSPALADGRLYVRSTRQGACFDLTSGR